jgi:hypothetical protein
MRGQARTKLKDFGAQLASAYCLVRIQCSHHGKRVVDRPLQESLTARLQKKVVASSCTKFQFILCEKVSLNAPFVVM